MGIANYSIHYKQPCNTLVEVGTQMLSSRPLSDLSFSDVDAFLRQQHGESVTLDYKKELLPDKKGHRYELCKDVSALANWTCPGTVDTFPSRSGLCQFNLLELRGA